MTTPVPPVMKATTRQNPGNTLVDFTATDGIKKLRVKASCSVEHLVAVKAEGNFLTEPLWQADTDAPRHNDWAIMNLTWPAVLDLLEATFPGQDWPEYFESTASGADPIESDDGLLE